MLNTIISLLRSSGVHAWEVADTKTRGWEFYFIRHELDQNRAKEVEHINVRVFQLIEDGQFMGSASAEIAPTATEEEAKALIEGLAYRATLVKNQPYTLQPVTEAHKARREQARVDVPRIAEQFIRTMGQLPETATEDVNSYEIFVSEITRRFITSQGIDVEETFPSSMIEVVVNARKEGREIELYRSYKSGTCDAEGLKRDLSRTMRYGKDRLQTSDTPALGKADVLFTTDDACSIYEYFVRRMDAQMVCRRMSDWEIGKPIAAHIRGDRVTVTALRELDNSSCNQAFDGEGAPIRDTVLLSESVPQHYLGNRMFSSYLGLEDSFIPGNFAVSGGSAAADELRGGRYLEIVEFSDFQVSPMNGDIAGEIRLGYLHDGDTVTVVEGGSVSGTMRELASTMRFSREQKQYNNYLIPALTRLTGVSITGAEG